MSELLVSVPSTTAATTDDTRYIVLRRMEVDWSEIGQFPGRSAEQAIRNACDGYASTDASTFVAVPERSWKPVSVKAEQTVTLKLEQAT